MTPTTPQTSPKFEQARETVAQLVKHFNTNITSYQASDYKEAQLRMEFIDKFFMALGWDLRNDIAAAPQYREVITEPSLDVEGNKKAPDYAFRVGQTPRFFVEAKKPFVPIETDDAAAFQIRSYGWTAKLPLCILTNFAHLAIYDTKLRPRQRDNVLTARINLIPAEAYPDNFRKIWDIFSREAVWAGSFDRFATDKKRGTGLVDEAFLVEIDRWREAIARNLASRNVRLGPEELNDAVQSIIDRIVFLRMAEDRGIEPDGQLRQLVDRPGIYDQLVRIWNAADSKYNSGLFDFSPSGDRLTPSLKLDDKVLSDMLSSLYYPKSPYAFKVLPTEILGSVYERFLGKVIRLTPEHHAKVDEKPDVKKAGGVYYTPAYIVNYIVEATLGKQIEGKSPRQLKGYRVLDMACGSGSFLLGVYNKLMAHYANWYTRNEPEKHKKAVWRFGTDWRLTLGEKKRILTEHIFGVDIDRQAVEVTKLSLLLKVLEDEDSRTMGRQLALFPDRILPNIDSNIKCGNSLIDPAYYAGQMIADKDEIRQVNPLDWRREFPAIMEDGGFDCIVGNPPYINIDDTWGRQDARLRAIKELYPRIHTDKTDILFYFFSKAVDLTTAGGQIGFIVSRAFLEAYKAEKLRGHLLGKCSLEEVIDFRNHYVFPGVGITTAIVRLSPGGTPGVVHAKRFIQEELISSDLERVLQDGALFEDVSLPQSRLTGAPWAFVSSIQGDVNSLIDSAGIPVGSVLLLGQGMQTGCNEVFGERTRQELADWGVRPRYKRATNTDIQRYEIQDRKEYLLYLEDETDFENLPKGLQAFMENHADELKKRAAYKRDNCEWWKFTWPLHKELYGNKRRILCPYLATRNRFAIDINDEFIGLTDTTVLFDNGQAENLKYILAILNSSLMTYRFKSIGKLKSNGILEYFWNSVSKLPVRRIDFTKAEERAAHDELVRLADRMTSLGQEEASEIRARQMAPVDKKIDEIVYGLYRLGQKQIEIVESALKVSSRDG
jgi:hypothetical protein